jgi:hypothetical protein
MLQVPSLPQNMACYTIVILEFLLYTFDIFLCFFLFLFFLRFTALSLPPSPLFSFQMTQITKDKRVQVPFDQNCMAKYVKPSVAWLLEREATVPNDN